MTVSELNTWLRTELFPEGLPENLVVPFATSIKAALIDMQRWIPCHQTGHISEYPQCSTYYRCGATLVDLPSGRITKVYTIPNYPTKEWCKQITYGQRNWKQFNSWYRILQDQATAPTQTGKPLLPFGALYPDSSSDSDYGRALVGIWCIHKDKLWVGPWLQSNESLIIEWDGINLTWADTDSIAAGEDVKRCAKLFVQKDHPEWFADGKDLAGQWRADYAAQLADLMYECDQRTRVNPDNTNQEDIESILLQKWEETTPVPYVTPATEPTSFACIGDFGSNDTNEQDVADLINASAAEFIVTVGDNHQDLLVEAAPDFDLSVGKYFADWIFPYNGVPLYGPGASTAKFYPAIGNHDYDTTVTPNTLTKFTDYFTLPNNGRYYDFIQGCVHFFVLNGSSNEADGISSTSTQAQWLQRRLALSTMPWKIVLVHPSPYSSGAVNGSMATLQWPFLAWGATMVISGHDHDYERLSVGGLPYIVNGIGGGALGSFGTAVAGSAVRYNTKHGAVFIDADCSQLVMTAKSVDDDVIDTLTITL